MKKPLLFIFALCSINLSAQSPNDILNLLTANQTITAKQADSLRADAAIKQQESDASRKSFLATAARSIQLSGYSQIRYQVFDEKNKIDGFDIRRARFDVRGNFSPYFSYRLQADFAGSPKLLDAYGEIKINNYLNITIGQFRIPFSLENLTSMNKFELIDFSQAVDAFTARGKDVIGNHNGRDIGLQLGGTLFKHNSINLVEYRVGVFNGSGINIADTSNNAKDIVGRLILNPLNGLSFGASYYNGWSKAIKPTSDFVGRNQARNRFGFEISYTNQVLSVKSEYIVGKDGHTEKAGWYILAGYYIIPSKFQAVAKFDSFDQNTETGDNITNNFVMGFNLNFNNWSRIQAFYTLRTEEGEAIENDYFSLQYQIGF